MNIQIFGIKKCFNTQKAERYFKERNIKFQFIDLRQKNMSKGEFESVKRAVGLDELINRKAKEYKELNLDRIGGSSIREEILFDHQQLLNTPVVRNGKQVTVGYMPEIWEKWE